MATSKSDITARPRSNGRKPPSFVGSDASVEQLRAQMKAVSSRNCTVLIYGESGTGKELVARHLHANSLRAAGPFVPLDCTTLSETLCESQLFGHVKGAFTGAEHATPGLFRSADGGTLFLDEVGELRLDMQAKLLRCIEEGVVVPLGAVEPVHVDVRIVAATHRDLREMVSRGEFREDLYFRLDVVPICIPPLRLRRGDIAPLAEHFLAQQVEMYGEVVKVFSDDAKRVLEAYSWPGNVRELRNVIEHAFVFSESDVLTTAELPESVRPAGRNRSGNGGGSNSYRFAMRGSSDHGPNGNGRKGNGPNGHGLKLHGSNGHHRVVPLHIAERCLIERALRATSGNQTQAAQLLGVERHRLSRMIRRHDIQVLARSMRASVVTA